MDVADASDAADTLDVMDVDAGPDPRDVLVDALTDTVWSGTAMRGGREREIEMRFRPDSFEWSEYENPYGPGQWRTLRFLQIGSDGASVDSTILSPTGWPTHPRNGAEEEWTFAVSGDAPNRVLSITGTVGTETFDEGALDAPRGFTAVVSSYSSGGLVDDAFCSSGLAGFNYDTLFTFARGGLISELLNTDMVIGAPNIRWSEPEGSNDFAVTDVPGFSDNGGTEMSEQQHFLVWYRGVIEHPGGVFGVRERDDVVEDLLWVLLGDDVGASREQDLFLEVHGYAWPDATSDEPSATFPAGDLLVEAMVIRCSVAISDVDVEYAVDRGPWGILSDAQVRPVTDGMIPAAFPE